MTTDLIKNPRNNKRHVVILGAGASLATTLLTNGDKNGRKLPIMDDLVKILGLEELLKQVEIEFKSKNFEDIYSELYSHVEYKNILEKIENCVYQYFNSLELPDNPTIYDYLVLSLRSKDVIATFNWDPLLPDAWERCRKITRNLPTLLFLHGNVRVATCERCKVIGKSGEMCPKCREMMIPTKLLYPIGEKNYNNIPFIKEQWDLLGQAINQAYALTIFGYGAPKSDVEAVNLMKKAWGNKEERSMEQIEIIDVKDEEELANTWSEFIYSHHYDTYKSFFDSILCKVPRRTIETYYERFFNVTFIDSHEYPKKITFDQLELFIQNLTKYEN